MGEANLVRCFLCIFIFHVRVLYSCSVHNEISPTTEVFAATAAARSTLFPLFFEDARRKNLGFCYRCCREARKRERKSRFGSEKESTLKCVLFWGKKEEKKEEEIAIWG